MWDGSALAGALSPKFYVALTGTSSLISGLILIFEWWYFRKYGTSFIEQVGSSGGAEGAEGGVAGAGAEAACGAAAVEERAEPNIGALLRGAEGARLAAAGRGALEPRDEALSRAEQMAWFGDGGVDGAAGAAAARAWAARGPARARAAREALRLDPACAPALLLLAEEEAPTVAEAERVLRAALPAAEAAAAAPHADPHAARRAAAVLLAVRRRLALCARRLGRLRDAARAYRDLAREAPALPAAAGCPPPSPAPPPAPLLALQAHECLLEVLLEQRAWGEAASALAAAPALGSTTALYTAALLRARAGAAAGAGAGAALEFMRRAVAHNPHVPAYLLEQRALSAPAEHVRRRGESEALAYAAAHLRHWRGVGADTARRLLLLALETWPACGCRGGAPGGVAHAGARRGVAACAAALCGAAALCAAAAHRWPETLAAVVAAVAALHPAKFLQALSAI